MTLATVLSVRPKTAEAAPSAAPMQLNGHSVYVNGNGLPPYSTCIDLAVVKRSLEGDLAVLEANLDMLRVEPDTKENRKTIDLSAAKVTYCREALSEVIRALELCRGAGATFAVAHVTASPLLLSGGVIDNKKRAFPTPGAIGLNGPVVQAGAVAYVDTGGDANVVVDSDYTYITYDTAGSATISVTGNDLRADVLAVGGGGNGGNSYIEQQSGQDLVLAGGGGASGIVVQSSDQTIPTGVHAIAVGGIGETSSFSLIGVEATGGGNGGNARRVEPTPSPASGGWNAEFERGNAPRNGTGSWAGGGGAGAASKGADAVQQDPHTDYRPLGGAGVVTWLGYVGVGGSGGCSNNSYSPAYPVLKYGSGGTGGTDRTPQAGAAGVVSLRVVTSPLVVVA